MSAPLTRRDLENFATKDDLKNFATKDDLKSFATKDDLKSFSTKDDLKLLREDIAILREDFAKDTQAAIRVISEENRAWFRTIDDQYKTLPERVRKLEEAVFPPPPRARRRKSG